MVTRAKRQESFMSRHWRGLSGFAYVTICVWDFIVMPMVYLWVQQFETQAVNDAYRQWQPLTLQGNGMFHLAFMAINGVSSWGKTQERTSENKSNAT